MKRQGHYPWSQTAAHAIIGLLVIFASLSVWQGLNNAVLRQAGSQDNQWGPSRVLLLHEDPYATYLDPGKRSRFMLSQLPNYPASGLILLWPYAVWDWPIAKTLWAISNLLFTGLILFALFRLLPVNTENRTKLVLASLFLMGTPWRNGVGNGQHALFSLCFLLVSVVALTRAPLVAGASLAMSWFKYTITFPLSLIFLRSRRGWNAILVASSTHALLTVFAAYWTQVGVLDLLIGPLKVAQSATGQGYLDVFAVAAVLGVNSKVLPTLVAVAILLVTYRTLRHDRDDLSCLSTLALASMTVCFHGGYDFVVLVIPLAYALRDGARSLRAQGYILLVAVVWFLDKSVDVMTSQGWLSALDGSLPAYFWLKVLAFYSVLIGDWLTRGEAGVQIALENRFYRSRRLNY